ncbi:hypothetical protein Tco_0876057 [Tanacetum coccineum]|uniref:RNA-directed DNA polymerase, eukaryota n=1 Tax=Tanacetum coccineum TaxID=301880 RepID=A0ABQ5BRK1_9ASTR
MGRGHEFEDDNDDLYARKRYMSNPLRMKHDINIVDNYLLTTEEKRLIVKHQMVRVIMGHTKGGSSILDILDEIDLSALSLQETKKESFSDLEVKYFWGNYQFDHIVSEALGGYGGVMVMGDFNEVRCKEDRWGSTFLAQGACSFNSFISNALGCGRVLMSSIGMYTARIIILFYSGDVVDFELRRFGYTILVLIPGFVQMDSSTWNSFILGIATGMIRFKKKASIINECEGVTDVVLKRANLSVKGIMIEGEWVRRSIRAFKMKFVSDLETSVSDEEIRKAVWGCGENKSPGLQSTAAVVDGALCLFHLFSVSQAMLSRIAIHNAQSLSFTFISVLLLRIF